MKKLILTAIVIFAFNTAKGQEKKTISGDSSVKTVEQILKITGFGKLKLGMDVKDLEELKEAKEMKTFNDFISKVYKNYSNKNVYEQIVDTTKIERGFGSPDKKVRIFTVPKINVTDEIVLKFVNLKFYDDKLYYVNCDYDKNLIDALTLKYGAPKVDTKEEDKEFTFIYTGNKITKKESKLTSNWSTGDINIICLSFMSNYFNSKGEQSFLSYANLYNKETLNMISKSESDFFDKRKAKEEAEKKSKTF